MSGICGILNLDGKAVDQQLLRDMTKFMSFRGPDAQAIWAEGNAGLGHTLLRTTFESEHEHQPHSLDGQVWITADARIDGQAELEKQLQANGRTVPAGATDAELILHAYHAWGENCLDHLIGDFAFAIWDGPQQKLFCARDHFGVKPFFYAQVGPVLVFSNTLDCVREHPAVSSTLNDLWIADFLLFEMSLDDAATAFADINRLPPSHCLTWSAEGLCIKRHWTLPTDLGIRYRPAGDYVEHFKMLLEQAVADRLRTNRIGVEMSGGMDSTSVAAIAKELLSRQGRPFELHAHTIVYDRLIRDEERHYAGLVAEKLAIPIHYLAADVYKLYERSDELAARLPEPWHDPELAKSADMQEIAAAHSRVVLTGWEGDALLAESPKTFFRYLLNERKSGHLLFAMAQLAFAEPRLVARAGWNWLRRLGTKPASQPQPPFPVWVSPDLEKRFDLRARWHRFHAAPAATHPLRPRAYRTYDYVQRLSNFFDVYDAGVSRQPLEYRHPLFDLRLIEYCLTLPPLPWCVNKGVLRAAMRGVLPESVRLRSKTPLAGWPYLELLRQAQGPGMARLVAAVDLCKYLDASKLPNVFENLDPNETWANLRPLSLNYWLESNIQ